MTKASKNPNAAHFQAIRRELAEELGYDPEKLTALESMRVDVVFGLKSSLDEMRAALYRGEPIDTGEMRSIADTIEQYLPPQPKPEPALDPRDDPHARLMRHIENWIEAQELNKRDAEAERVAQGLPADSKDARIAELEAENARLRGEPLTGPDGERVIDPPTGDIVPPGEQPGRNLRVGKQVGPDDHKAAPKPVIEGKAMPVPPQAKSGAETKAQMARVNADRSLEYKIMNAPSRVAHEPKPSNGTESWRFPQAAFRREW
jgi:hypothetical protein